MKGEELSSSHFQLLSCPPFRYGKVDRVKKIKDYAFVHFEERDQAVEAMRALDCQEWGGAKMEISLAKPPSDKKKKEDMLRKREQRMMQAMAER